MRVMDVVLNTFDKIFVTHPEPAPEPGRTAEPERDRKTELLAEIRTLDRELADHDSAMSAFRAKHMATVNGRLVFLYPRGSDTGEGRERIEGEFRKLVTRRDEIQRERNKTLAELSRYAA